MRVEMESYHLSLGRDNPLYFIFSKFRFNMFLKFNDNINRVKLMAVGGNIFII